MEYKDSGNINEQITIKMTLCLSTISTHLSCCLPLTLWLFQIFNILISEGFMKNVRELINPTKNNNNN